MLLRLKKERNSDPWTTGLRRDDLVLGELKGQILCDSAYRKCLKQANSWRQKAEQRLSRTGRSGKWGLTVKKKKKKLTVSMWNDEKFLEMDSGGLCIASWVNLMSLYCALKMVTFMCVHCTIKMNEWINKKTNSVQSSWLSESFLWSSPIGVQASMHLGHTVPWSLMYLTLSTVKCELLENMDCVRFYFTSLAQAECLAHCDNRIILF